MDVGERMTPHNQFNDEVRDEFTLHIHRYRLAIPSCIDKTVLDSGCGVGNGSFLLSAVASHITAIDDDPEAIEFAQKYYPSTNLTFIRHEVLQPLAHSFETVVSFDVIEHLAEPERYIKRLAEQLATGGTLIISTPNKNMLQLLYPEPNPFHLSELTDTGFSSLLQKYVRITHLVGQVLQSGSAATTTHLSDARAFMAWCTTK